MIFQLNKKNNISYYIKDNNLYLDIAMKTLTINITNNIIEIEYIIIDSNNKYKYYIEMSD